MRSFVWRSRRPFHAGRLYELLHDQAGWRLPGSASDAPESAEYRIGGQVVQANKKPESAGAEPGSSGGGTIRHPLANVIRSKGLVGY